MDQLALGHAVFYETSATNQFFGFKGEYSNLVNKEFTSLKRFWDIKSDNIDMVAAHGSMLQDRNKVFKTYKAYGLNDRQANDKADSVATFLKTYPQYLNGDHSAFTYNQYATPDSIYPEAGRVTRKIIIGDGILQGYAALGYGDIAAQAILAHEFGHQIQLSLGILKNGMIPTPKTARRVELMADAYAAYYLSHARGAALQRQSMQQVLEVFFNVGDCRFAAPSHHGTPTQNKAAAEWGYKLANDAHKQGHILPSREFARLFDAALQNILRN